MSTVSCWFTFSGSNHSGDGDQRLRRDLALVDALEREAEVRQAVAEVLVPAGLRRVGDAEARPCSRATTSSAVPVISCLISFGSSSMPSWRANDFTRPAAPDGLAGRGGAR